MLRKGKQFLPSFSNTRRVTLVTNPVISHEWGKEWEVFTTSGRYPWSFVAQIFHNGQPSHGGNLTKRNPWFSSFLVGSNPLSRNHKLWNIVSTERYILHMQVLLECCYIYICKWKVHNKKIEIISFVVKFCC